MRVHRSNQTEQILAALAEVIARPQADPFAPECIVVQGPGMERWLSQQLSSALSVFANPDFVHPRALLERALKGVLGEVEAPGIDFEPETLMWSIAELLPGMLEGERFDPIRAYLDGDPRGEKLIQLAQRIADTFDHYVIYRPQMVLAWASGRGAEVMRQSPVDPDWQADLWRALVQRHGSTHFAARMMAFLEAIEGGATLPSTFPERISLFGIPTLPPLYVAGLSALASQVEVNLFLLSPSREYWGEIRSAREILRELRSAGADAEQSESTLHLSEGNPLLASLGKVGRDFQQVLEGTVDYVEGEQDLYRVPQSAAGDATLLATVQADILALRHRGGVAGDADPLPMRPDDRSISVHSCHGPMREAEVLRDQLLDLFERDPSLEPRDVVVMTPDAEAYAPYLEAIFGNRDAARGGAAPGRIPCRFADRSASAAYPVVDGFSKLLDTLQGRMKASELLDLLGTECIRSRFGISAEDEPILREWVDRSGIRWGVDGRHRAEHDQPEVSFNTWRFGLERLLLGHAFAAEGRRLFAGRLPFDDIEGGRAELVGRLADFCDVLFRFRERIARALPLPAWNELLSDLLDRMLVRDAETEHQHLLIREKLQELASGAERSRFKGALTLRSVGEQLGRALSRSVQRGGFLSGGVTFCEMVPMRTIPFRVVCLMGMNDDSFPRIRRPLGFDLIPRRPMLGDRTSRDDDRYLFLEALTSTRQRMIITYVGQSIRDNEPLPPSVVVGELLDYLGDAFRVTEAKDEERPSRGGEEAQSAIRNAVVVKHPLQPFSPRYFDGGEHDSRLFSHAEHYCEAARALGDESDDARPFVSAPLPADPEALDEVGLDELVDFFRSPARAFLQRRLGLRLADEGVVVEDREPMQLAGLEGWRVGDALLDRVLAGTAAGSAEQVFRAQGVLPLGVPGACAMRDVEREVEELAGIVSSLRTGAPLPDLPVDCRLGELRITGTLGDLWPTGRVVHQYSKLGQLGELEAWIRHVVLCHVSDLVRERGGEALALRGPVVSHVVGRPEGDGVRHIRFVAPERPTQLLAHLLQIHAMGQRAPLPLFGKSSRRYAKILLGKSGDPEAQASLSAYNAYRGSDERPGERADPYVAQVFSAVDPLSPSFSPLSPIAPGADGGPARSDAETQGDEFGFRALARRVFLPMLAHREVVR